MIVRISAAALVVGLLSAGPTYSEQAIVNGRHEQPRLQPGQKPVPAQSQAFQKLLDQEARDPAETRPLVQPTDIYGNPLGGNPGANPPKPSR